MAIVLDGTTGITNDGGYTGDGVVFADTTPANTLVTTTGGNVGIGTSSPAARLTVSSPTNTASGSVDWDGSGATANLNYSGTFATDTGPALNFSGLAVIKGAQSSAGGGNGYLSFMTRNSSGGQYATERARIDSSGNLLVGTTSNPNSSKLVVNGGISTTSTQFNMTGNSGATFEWVLRTGSTQSFYVNNATVVATLSTTGVWTNASDARYKENIVDSQYGISAVMSLKPRAYNLIDQSDKPQIGFIAQEVLEIVPEVVDTTFNSITKEDRYTLSYGQLTAVLTKAIQEQQAIINAQQAALTALTARVEALEGTQP